MEAARAQGEAALEAHKREAAEKEKRFKAEAKEKEMAMEAEKANMEAEMQRRLAEMQAHLAMEQKRAEETVKRAQAMAEQELKVKQVMAQLGVGKDKMSDGVSLMRGVMEDEELKESATAIAERLRTVVAANGEVDAAKAMLQANTKYDAKTLLSVGELMAEKVLGNMGDMERADISVHADTIKDSLSKLIGNNKTLDGVLAKSKDYVVGANGEAQPEAEPEGAGEEDPLSPLSAKDRRRRSSTNAMLSKGKGLLDGDMTDVSSVFAKIRNNEDFIKEIKQVAVLYVEDAVQSADIPDIAVEKDWGEYSITHLKVADDGLEISGDSLTLGNDGVSTLIKLQDVNVNFDDFEFSIDKRTFPKLNDTGKATLKISNLGVEVRFDIETNDEKNLTVTNTQAAISIAEMEVSVSEGSHVWVYNKLLKLFKAKIITVVTTELETQAKDKIELLQAKFQEILKSINL